MPDSSRKRTAVNFIIAIVSGIILIIVTGLMKGWFGSDKIEVTNFPPQKDTLLVRTVNEKMMNEDADQPRETDVRVSTDTSIGSRGPSILRGTKPSEKSAIEKEQNKGGTDKENDPVNAVKPVSLDDGLKTEAKNRENMEELTKVIVTDLRTTECKVQNGPVSIFFYGQACFENKTDFDLVLTVPESFSGIPDEGLQETKVLIPKGGKNCFPKMIVSVKDENAVRNVPYTFTTVNTAYRKSGKIIVKLETCMIKTSTVSKYNLFLE